MTTIFNRRDIGFTIISRFEETYRKFLIDSLGNKYADYREGIPSGIVTKTNEKSDILFFDDPSEFFENTDFPDLLETTIYKDNFTDFFKKSINKDELVMSMTQLYSLRCKIAHVKGFLLQLILTSWLR